VSKKRYAWAAPGDINAFFGLMLDNIADLLLTIGLLSSVFGFPTNFALVHMVPGTAIGVLVGDLLFFWMALRLARRTGRSDVTAMPLGLDTPSTIGMVFFVLGPAFLHARDTLGMSELEAARHTWHIGICSIVISGVFKFGCALGSGWIRRVVPRAGLLGSLAAIALVLISFLPLLEVLHSPIVGLVALAVILTTLVARVRLPFRIPGALGALVVAGSIFYFMEWTGLLDRPERDFQAAAAGLFPTGWLEAFRFEWLAALDDTLRYLPIVIPFALATVVGGIDCTESAAAAGDEYNTNRIIGVEALATLVAGLCGGVIQTTPYIGHPAYKAMGGRAAYTLATALFVGSAGLLGYFGYLYLVIPKATVFPILIFIGLEITAQSFLATTPRHYPAIALACVPALAALAIIYVDKVAGEFGRPEEVLASVSPALQVEVHTVRVLANGFIVTSLLWASILAALIDRKLYRGAVFCGVAALFSLFGIMHSPLPGGPIFVPLQAEWLPVKFAEPPSWLLQPEQLETPYRYAIGYLLVAVILIAWGAWRQSTGAADQFDDAYDHREETAR
jgi:AGZA family xanthine/uracil permease-like MFS transporter